MIEGTVKVEGRSERPDAREDEVELVELLGAVHRDVGRDDQGLEQAAGQGGADSTENILACVFTVEILEGTWYRVTVLHCKNLLLTFQTQVNGRLLPSRFVTL